MCYTVCIWNYRTGKMEVVFGAFGLDLIEKKVQQMRANDEQPFVYDSNGRDVFIARDAE